MNIIIRKAILEDINDIQSLSQKLIEYENNICKNEYMVDLDWSHSDDAYQIFKMLIEKHYVYIAEHNKKIIGYMAGRIIPKSGCDTFDIMKLDNLYVEKLYRSCGIGTAFLNIFKKICLNNKINFIKLDTLSDNEKTIKFYKKNGLYNYNTIMMCNLNNESSIKDINNTTNKDIKIKQLIK
ncbi:MAG: GNAT family N-acetyltransferase [Bacilli bacterium]|nr:GNAT family N-acetyltransferase [Bacilli bacterium]